MEDDGVDKKTLLLSLHAAVQRVKVPFLHSCAASARLSATMVADLSGGRIVSAYQAYLDALEHDWAQAPMPDVLCVSTSVTGRLHRDVVRRAAYTVGACRVVPLASGVHPEGVKVTYQRHGWAVVRVPEKYDVQLDDVVDKRRFDATVDAIDAAMKAELARVKPKGFQEHPSRIALDMASAAYQQHATRFGKDGMMARQAVHGEGHPPFAVAEVPMVVQTRGGIHEPLQAEEAGHMEMAGRSVEKASEAMEARVQDASFPSTCVFGDMACPTFWTLDAARHLCDAVKAALPYACVEMNSRRDAMRCHADISSIPAEKAKQVASKGKGRFDDLFEQAVSFDAVARSQSRHMEQFSRACEPLVAYGIMGADELKCGRHAHKVERDTADAMNKAQTEQMLRLSDSLATSTTSDPVRVQLMLHDTEAARRTLGALENMLSKTDNATETETYYGMVNQSAALSASYRRLNQHNLLFIGVSHAFISEDQARQAALCLFGWTTEQWRGFWGRAVALTHKDELAVEEKRRFVFPGVGKEHVVAMGVSTSLHTMIKDEDRMDVYKPPTSMRRRQQAEALHRDAVTTVAERIPDVSERAGPVRLDIAGTLHHTYQREP